MTAPQSQPDNFKPAMPRIPGVNDGDSPSAGSPRMPRVGYLLFAATLCMAGGLGWWTLHARSKAAATVAAGSDPGEVAPALSASLIASAPPGGSNPRAVATLEEMVKPWSAKKFTFINPVTHASVPAMILRLPGTVGSHSNAYWAFSLNAPYTSCQLEYVTDLGQIAARYAYHANHPMVVSACGGMLYDPLRLGTVPSGAWVRGDIAQGGGIRPPLSIEVTVEGNRIIASRME